MQQEEVSVTMVMGRKEEQNSEQSPTISESSSSTDVSSCLEEEEEEDEVVLKDKLIGINGYWYNVTKFIPHHPGGAELLKEFVGRDATEVFEAFHYQPLKVLKRVKRQGPKMETSHLQSKDLEFSNDFRQLIQTLRDDGYFEPHLGFMMRKMILVFVFLGLAIYYLHVGTEEARNSTSDSSSSGDANKDVQWKAVVKAAVCMSLFFQQSGFLMHDFMHNNWFHSRKWDQALGRVYGCLCVGLSSIFWRDEHFIHHTFTNTIDMKLKSNDDDKKHQQDQQEPRIVDVQMYQDSWVQDMALLPFFDGTIPDSSTFKRGLNILPLWMAALVVKFQALLWLPLAVVFGRYVLVLESFKLTNSPLDRVLQIIHVLWFFTLVHTMFPTLPQACVFHLLVSMGQGVLHVQLLLNHYVTPWYDIEQVKTSCWYLKQIMTTVNMAPFLSTRFWLQRKTCNTTLEEYCEVWDEYVAPLVDDWFHGGLNLHIEHHTIPCLPRSSLRECRRRIRKLCASHNIHYDERHSFTALWDTMMEMHKVGQAAQFFNNDVPSPTKQKQM